MPRKLVHIGGWMAAAGLVTGTASIFVPWMQQLVVAGRARRVESLTILALPKGFWYVMLLLTLFALLGAAAMGSNQGRKLAGLAGPVVSLVTAFVVVGLITMFDGKTGGPGRVVDVATQPGGWLALVSMPLLGFACGLIAIGRARPAVVTAATG